MIQIGLALVTNIKNPQIYFTIIINETSKFLLFNLRIIMVNVECFQSNVRMKNAKNL